MKFYLMCYKVPMSARMAYIGHHYVYKKTVQTYNNENPGIFQLKSTKNDTEVSHIIPSKFPNSKLLKILPDCVNCISKTTIDNYPLVSTDFRLLSILEMGNAISVYYFSEEKYEKHPKAFNQYIKGSPKCNFYDFTTK